MTTNCSIWRHVSIEILLIIVAYGFGVALFMGSVGLLMEWIASRCADRECKSDND